MKWKRSKKSPGEKPKSSQTDKTSDVKIMESCDSQLPVPASVKPCQDTQEVLDLDTSSRINTDSEYDETRLKRGSISDPNGGSSTSNQKNMSTTRDLNSGSTGTTGDRKSGSSTNDRNSGSATGDRKSGSSTSDRNSGSATGDRNSGSSTSDRNSGSTTGDWNCGGTTGDRNSGSSTSDLNEDIGQSLTSMTSLSTRLTKSVISAMDRVPPEIRVDT